MDKNTSITSINKRSKRFGCGEHTQEFGLRFSQGGAVSATCTYYSSISRVLRSQSAQSIALGTTCTRNRYNRQAIKIKERDQDLNLSYRIFPMHACMMSYASSGNSAPIVLSTAYTYSATRMANLIMSGSPAKGLKKGGKRMLAYKLLCIALLQVDPPRLTHVSRSRNQSILPTRISFGNQDTCNFCSARPSESDLFCRIDSKSGFADTRVLRRDVETVRTATESLIDTAGQAIDASTKMALTPRDSSTQSHKQFSREVGVDQRYTCKEDNMSRLRVVQPIQEVAPFKQSAVRSATPSPVSFVVKKTRLSSKQKYNKAIFHTFPSVEVRKVRIGGAPYQLPIATNKRRQEGLALRSFIFFAAQKQAKSWLPAAQSNLAPQRAASNTDSRLAPVKPRLQPMRVRKQLPQHAFDSHLSFELAGACNKSSQSMTQRDQMHSTAAINRGYQHYRWW